MGIPHKHQNQQHQHQKPHFFLLQTITIPPYTLCTDIQSQSWQQLTQSLSSRCYSHCMLAWMPWPSQPPSSLPKNILSPPKEPASAPTWTTRKPTPVYPNSTSWSSPAAAATPSSNPNPNPSDSSKPSPISKRNTPTRNAPSSPSAPAVSSWHMLVSCPVYPPPHILTSMRSSRRSAARCRS